jgi:ketosteroid isomerase-like protein
MGSPENIAAVERLLQFLHDRDWEQLRDLLAEDAVFHMAGMPPELGGLLKGPDEIIEGLKQAPAGSYRIDQIIADDESVCVLGEWNVPEFPGTDFLRGSDQGFIAEECDVYRLKDGKFVEATSFVNWLHAYVQMGLVDVGGLVKS